MSLSIVEYAILHVDSQGLKALPTLRRTGCSFVEEERRWTARGARGQGEQARWLQS